MRVNDQPAFILHRREFRDSSLILDLFTLDHGRISVLARGARQRRDRASFQPFHRLSLGWSGNSDLKTLTSIEALALPLDPACYLAAYYVNELLLYLVPAQDPHEKVFHAYQQLLVEIGVDNMEAVLRAFEMDLLCALGLMPDLLHVSRGGVAVSPRGFYRVDPEHGVVVADDREPVAVDGASLHAIDRREFSERETLRAARRVLRLIIDFHLHGRTLQSRKLYQQMYSSGYQ